MKRPMAVLLVLCLLLAGCSKEVEQGPVLLIEDPPVPEYYEVYFVRLRIVDVIDYELGTFRASVLEADAEINLLETGKWVTVQMPLETLRDSEDGVSEPQWREWHKHSVVEIEDATYDATTNALYVESMIPTD